MFIALTLFNLFDGIKCCSSIILVCARTMMSELEVLLWGLFLLPSGTIYLGARAEARNEAVE